MGTREMRFGLGALGGLFGLFLAGLLGLFDFRNRPVRAFAVCLIFILLFAFLPVISVLISLGIANALGCPLDEGNAHSCLFLGFDLGDLLSMLFVSGWFGLLTIPYGAILLLIWLFAIVVFTVKHLRARGQSSPI